MCLISVFRINFIINVFQGKSLYVKSLVNAMQDVNKEGFTHKTIRLSESHLRPEHIIQQFQAYEDKPTDTVPRLFHFDVPPVVSLLQVPYSLPVCFSLLLPRES